MYTTDTAAEGSVMSDAAQFLRDRWGDFLGWGSRLVDMQHRAAIAAQSYRAQGDADGERAAKALILTLGKLNITHGKLVDHFQTLAPWVGLGAIQIPIALAAGAGALAVALAWWLRSANLQAELLEQLEAGTLTEAGYLEAMKEIGDAPGPLAATLNPVANVAKWAAVAFLAWAALEAVGMARAFKPNPGLAIFQSNPPGNMSTRVWGLAYRHEEDQDDYYHEFGPDVEMEAQEDGSVRIAHQSGRPVWREF